MVFHRAGWQSILVVGSARSFKSSLSKDIAVKVSKHKKVCIFSLKNEWERHIIHYSNYKYAEYRQKLTDYKILSNFSVKISDFEDTNDFIALGFTPDSCRILGILIEEGIDYYKDDPTKFIEMLMYLPIRDKTKEGINLLDQYENCYHVRLDSAIPYMTKQSIVNHFSFIKDWFWCPGDNRPYYDFEKEWLENKHLIISISKNTNKARALCGLILKKFRNLHTQTKGFFVFEEMRTLAPDMDLPDYLLPSSIIEIYDLMTLLPKYGCAMLGITQSEDQIFQKCKEHFFTRFVGGNVKGIGDAYKKAERLKWKPHAYGGRGYREVLLWNKDGSYFPFIPHWACCRC